MDSDQMTYEIFDTDSADVLGSFDSLDAAKAAAADLVTKHSDLRDEIAIFVIDAAGVRVGDPLWAADLVAPPLPGVLAK